MRYFVIRDPKERVAVVFHDSSIGYVLCRSKNDSFRASFDVVSKKINSRFSKKKDSLILEVFDVSNHDWIDSVLDTMCSGGYWTVEVTGDISGAETEIDNTIRLFLL